MELNESITQASYRNKGQNRYKLRIPTLFLPVFNKLITTDYNFVSLKTQN